jgi:hypothetical protein
MLKMMSASWLRQELILLPWTALVGVPGLLMVMQETIWGFPSWLPCPVPMISWKRMGFHNRISLIAGRGLRTSADFVKCLALGADAVYIGTAALIAMNCQQYRVCYTGLCPTGVATQNPQLIEQLNVEDGITKLSNFLKISTEEIVNITRMVGKNDVDLIDREDLVSLNRETAVITGVKWLDGHHQT